jgi:hypothetical protein
MEFRSATAKHYRNLCVNFRRLPTEDEIKQVHGQGREAAGG